jgi:hypothetical protein
MLRRILYLSLHVDYRLQNALLVIMAVMSSRLSSCWSNIAEGFGALVGWRFGGCLAWIEASLVRVGWVSMRRCVVVLGCVVESA